MMSWRCDEAKASYAYFLYPHTYTPVNMLFYLLDLAQAARLSGLVCQTSYSSNDERNG